MNFSLKEASLLLVLSFVCTSAIFLRSSLFGWDGYATSACIKHGFCHTLGWQEGALFFFQFFPGNLFFFKFFMFSMLFLTLVPIYLTVRNFYSKRDAFYSVFLLLTLSPFLLFEFSKFENELFAFPLIAWGLYFLLRKNYFNWLVFWLFSFCFWLWPGYFRYNNILSPGPTLEQLRFAGVLNLWFLFPLVFFIPLLDDRRLKFFGVLSVGLFLWNTKFFLFLLFFVGLTIPIALKKIGEWADSFGFSWFDLNYVFILALFCGIGVNCALLIQQPTPQQLFVVEEAIWLSEEENLNLYNDWAYGYWLWEQGYLTKNHPGSSGQINFSQIYSVELERPFFVLSEMDLVEENCVVVKQYSAYFGKKITLWKCS